MYASLRDFVHALDAAGELRRVTTPVDPVLQVAALADVESRAHAPNPPAPATRATDPRFHALGGQALLLENVVGSRTPVLINAFGSYRRMEMALGLENAGGLEGLASRLAELTKPQPPRSLSELIARGKQFLPLLRIPPRRSSRAGPCQQVVLTGDQVDLTTLPILRCWPHDGDFAALGYPAHVNEGIDGLSAGPEWNARFRGRYITLAGIHTIHADDRNEPRPASHNIGMYRVQLLGPRRLAMHWHMHHDGARHWRSWKKLGQPMPVAIVLGGESVLPYAATAPLPPGLSELLLAGFLSGRGIPMTRAKTVPLWVPANAEIVIEGLVSHDAGFIGWDPRETDEPLGPGAVFEGPFGDHTGFYSMPDRYPLVRVTAVTTRKDPIYPTTVVGLPPQEDYFLGKSTERIFLPLLRTLLPDIEDYDLPMFGAFHNCAFLRIKKSYPFHARRVMHGVWGAGQMAWTKTIFVVDDDVDVHDARAVFAAAAAHCDPARDIEQVWGPLDILDHAAPRLGAGRKVGFDCTRKIAGEEAHASDTRARAPFRESAALATRVRRMPGVQRVANAYDLPSWMLVQVRKDAPGVGRALAQEVLALADEGFALPPFVIILGEDCDLADSEAALFRWMAHSDASRDWTIAGRTLVVDATPKQPGDERDTQPVRPWPPLLVR